MADDTEVTLGPGNERLQRALLRAVLEPPAFGGFIGDLARRLGESEADTRATAMALQDKLLATVGDGYIAATGAAMEFDALCRRDLGEPQAAW